MNVKVININQQNQHPILKHCQTMCEYSVFVNTVRKWKGVDTQNGFQKAIEECIANNILKDYLKRKTREVLNMLLAEYDYEADIAVQRAEEREIAFAEGEERGSYQKAIETAKLMCRHNYLIAEICTMTGLSQEEIESV